MAEHRGETFRQQRVVVDGNAYFNCVFEDCRIVFCGTAGAVFHRPKMRNCGFELEGAADRTMQYFTMLYAGGAKDLVEEVFAAVRGQHGRGPGGTTPTTSLTLDRVSFKGVGTGLSLPEGSQLNARDTQFEDVRVGIEVRDRQDAIDRLRSLGLPTEISPNDFAEMLGEWEANPPQNDAEKVERIGKFATAKQWLTGSFATAGGSIALIANLLKIADSQLGKAAAAYIRAHWGS